MKYLLTMTTNGRRDCFRRTVESFLARVKPHPTEVFIYDDGRRTGVDKMLRAGDLDFGEAAVVTVAPQRWHRPAGFCKATAHCWAQAAATPLDWHFHLEDDFVVVRHVDLRDIAHVMQQERHVSQMALMRNPVNDVEKAAGGLFESRLDAYTLRGAGGQYPWLEHRAYFTTNPSLMPTSLAKGFPWPDEPHCEGVYDHGLRRALPDTTYGAWGSGSAWVQHIGERAGFGY